MKYVPLMILFGMHFCLGQTGAMWYNNYSRTLSSFALGEQGVASRNGIDGLIYNPANLVHSQGTHVSFFRNPYYYLGFDGMPMKSYAAVMDLPHDIHIGAEYMSWDQYYTSYGSLSDPFSPVENHSYNRTAALAAATHLSPDWGVGILIRYAKDHYESNNNEHFFGSAGVQYLPESFQEQLRIGFSLMNFSTPLTYEVRQRNGQTLEYNDTPSSFMRLGFEYDIARHELFRTTVHAEVSKELVKRNGNDGQSSFQSLFNDWHDTPRDLTIHGGLSFIFQPIPLGRSFTFIQEIYAGYLHDGPKSGRRTMFYNGFNAGFGLGGSRLVAGYSGLWHIVDDDVYGFFTNAMPWETFQVSFHSVIPGVNAVTENSGELTAGRITLSIGGGYVYRTGRTAEQKVSGPPPEYYTVTTSDAPSYTVESAFYLSDRSALTANFRYEHRSITYTVFAGLFGTPPILFRIPLRMETLTLSSAYRYHPFEELEPLFFEAGFGVQRQNPIEITRPRYKYNTTFYANTGVLIAFSKMIITPKAAFMTLMDRVTGSAPRLAAYNQFELSLTIGYLFE
jgi:hypothetical protein